VTLGKLLGGATISVIQGTIPLLFLPLLFLRPGESILDPGDLARAVSASFDVVAIVQAWVVMFFMGIFMTALGVIIASRLKTYEGFGAISNGVIQPLYFLSGSIFPLRGVIGGVGFMEIPEAIRDELRRIGIFAIGGGWVVQLPTWLQVIVYSNPVTYQLDMLRYVLLDFEQMPLTTDLLVTFALPPAAAAVAAWSMARMLKGK
jgi:ABC-2 type transport system permease protein